MSNLREFQTSLNGFEGEILKAHGDMMKRVAFAITKDVVEATPVDTGRAQSNWQIGINESPSEEITTIRGPGATIKECMSRIKSAKSGDVIVLTNNVPYIEALENGHSGQAPFGMIAVAVARASGLGY